MGEACSTCNWARGDADEFKSTPSEIPQYKNSFSGHDAKVKTAESQKQSSAKTFDAVPNPLISKFNRERKKKSVKS